ncbi:MAG: hypothetical protein RL557_133 [archaeon]|jgi:hypothetical protein
MFLYKSGQAHVEMVLAFVLFTGFLVFIFIMINPLFRAQETLSIDNEKTILLEKMSTVVGKIPVMVESDSYCYSISKIQSSYGNAFRESKDAVVSGKQVRYVLYFADFITSAGTISCSDRPSLNNKGEDAFRFGSYGEETFISQSKVIALKQLYESDYTALATNLGIGNFAFSFRKIDGTKVPALSINSDKILIPENVPVVAVDIPVVTVDSLFVKEEMILTIQMW